MNANEALFVYELFLFMYILGDKLWKNVYYVTGSETYVIMLYLDSIQIYYWRN